MARMLSASGISANDPGYIEHWWKNPEYIMVNDDYIPVFFVEHPRKVEDMRIIFDVTSKQVFGGADHINVGSIVVTEEKMIESYVAARYIQRMRNDVLKGKQLKSWGMSVRTLIDDMRRYISSLVENTVTERIDDVILVKVKKEIRAFSKLSDFKDFFKIIM